MPGSKGPSPFVPGEIAPPEQFYGRRVALFSLKSIVDTGRSRRIRVVFVAGGTGAGKSSFLRFVWHRVCAESRWIGAEVLEDPEDLETACRDSVAGLLKALRRPSAPFRRALSKLEERFGGVSTPIGGFTLRDRNPPKVGERFVRSIERIWLACLAHTVPVDYLAVFWDNCETLVKIPEFPKFVRSLDEASPDVRSLPLLLILAGSEKSLADLEDSAEFLARRIQKVYLDPFTEEEAAELVTQTLMSVGSAATPETLQYIFDYTKGNPFLIQLLGDGAFRAAASSEITLDDAKAGLDLVSERLEDDFVRACLIRVPEQEVRERILSYLASRELNEEISVRELAAACGIERKAAEVIVASFESKNMIQRQYKGRNSTFHFKSPIWNLAIDSLSKKSAYRHHMPVVSRRPDI